MASSSVSNTQAACGLVFLDVAPGMSVIVLHDFLTDARTAKDWWMGQVIQCGGAARDPKTHNLFQIVDVDSDEISWVNADLVTHILQKSAEEKCCSLKF